MRYFERLSRRYSRNRLVVVSVIVTESHRKMVHVIGRVANPGAYPLKTVNGSETVGPGRRLR